MGNEGSSQSPAQSEPIQNTVNIDWALLGPDQNDDVCSSRDGHSACAVGSCVYVFGGVLGSSTNSMPVESSDLFEYNVDLKKWRKIDAKGEIPKPRSGSTMVSVENKLYLFGGLSQNVGWFDDLSVFNIETETWNKITAASGAAPSPRDKLTSVAINRVLYFFGGFGPHAAGDDSSQDSQDEDWEDMEDEQPRGPSANFGWFDDVYSFDTEANKWELVTPIKLHAPSPRAAHSMCSVGDKIIIFGGRDCEARRNDMYILDTTEKKWLPINGQGSPPAPRSFHAMVAVGKRVVVFGGRSQNNQHFNDCHIFDTETMEWLQPTSKGSLPEARGSHTLTNVGETLVLFGGTSEFDTETMQCKRYHSDVCLLKTVDILSGAAIPKAEEKENEKSVDNIQLAKQPEVPTKTTEHKAENDIPNGQEV